MEERAFQLFQATYGREPDRVAQAPGRVNLIGEHVDFLGGLVLPAAIDRYVAVASSSASAWQVESATPGGESMLAALGSELGAGPARVAVAADLPVGSGLSSSAALLVAGAAALAPRIDGLEAALACQRAEQRATGVLVGIMDQYVSALGRKGHALLLDCSTVRHRLVAFPPDLTMAVIDSGIHHQLASTPYNERRQEAIEAVEGTGLPLLEIPPEQDNPRLRHVASELQRVRDFVTALERGDRASLGRLLNESHRSLRDDYQCSLPEIDDLVDRAREAPGCLGARIMGGGFGGSVLALIESGREADLQSHVGRAVIVCRPADGAFVSPPSMGWS